MRHTLTDFEVEGKEEEVSSDYWLPGRHYHFTSQWNPFKPESGDLLTEDGEEAGLRGRIDQAMLSEQLPAPAEGVRVAVCGPPEMWEDMKAALLELGHAEQNLVELKALTDDQVRWAPWFPRGFPLPAQTLKPCALRRCGSRASCRPRRRTTAQSSPAPGPPRRRPRACSTGRSDSSKRSSAARGRPSCRVCAHC